MRRADGRTVAALDRLLAAERAAVREGRIGDLDGLAQRKAELMAGLSVTAQDAGALGRMRSSLARQERFLAAARRGADGARPGAPPPPLTTYGPDGSAGSGAGGAQRVVRRV